MKPDTGFPKIHSHVLAAGVYEAAIKAFLAQYPHRSTAEKLARDLIQAGGKPVPVLFGLANAFAGPTVYSMSPHEIEKRLASSSVDRVIKDIRDLQKAKR